MSGAAPAFQLRHYQREAVATTLAHFRRRSAPACIVLPTGAGKSVVIAELARLAKGRVLVLAHVKELCEQNHEKYTRLGLPAGLYAAGLGRKEVDFQVTFASVQLYVTTAPGAIDARSGISAWVRAQPGASASVTTTLVRTELPSLVTVIVKVAVWPIRIVC